MYRIELYQPTKDDCKTDSLAEALSVVIQHIDDRPFVLREHKDEYSFVIATGVFRYYKIYARIIKPKGDN